MSGREEVGPVVAAGCEGIGVHPLLDGLISVDWNDYLIVRAVKDDGGYGASIDAHSGEGIVALLEGMRAAVPHSFEGGVRGGCGLILQA